MRFRVVHLLIVTAVIAAGIPLGDLMYALNNSEQAASYRTFGAVFEPDPVIRYAFHLCGMLLATIGALVSSLLYSLHKEEKHRHTSWINYL